MVSSTEALDIVEIVLFIPAFLVSIFVCVKHGFSREAGWLLITILATVRIIGGATGVAGERENNTGLLIASLVLNGIGSATLVGAITGVVNRIDTGSGLSRLPPRIRKFVQIFALASVVLGSLAGSKVASSDPDTRNEGYTYLKVAVILIFLQLLVTTYILAVQFLKIHKVLDSDRRLAMIAAAALPFVFVRSIYSICAAFDPTSPTFSTRSHTLTAVILRGVLGIAMEIIATALLLLGGMIAPSMKKDTAARSEEVTPLGAYRGVRGDSPALGGSEDRFHGTKTVK